MSLGILDIAAFMLCVCVCVWYVVCVCVAKLLSSCLVAWHAWHSKVRVRVRVGAWVRVRGVDKCEDKG